MQCLGTLTSGLVVSLAVWSADAARGTPARSHDHRRIAPLTGCLQRETSFFPSHQ
jgi:hypothetical protein